MEQLAHIDYDPLSAESQQHTHAIFARLRSTCPLHHHRMPRQEVERQSASFLVAEPTEEFWSLFRYDDINDALQQPTLFSNRAGPGPERLDLMGTEGMLLWADDPTHRRQRRIANKAFLPKVVQQRLPVIQTAIDETLDALLPGGRAEVMSQISIPLTIATITDIFGIGADQREAVARWGPLVMATMGGDADVVAEAARVTASMFEYLVGEIELRRAALKRGEPLSNDVISALVIGDGESGFSNDEICMAANQFLVAGYETTATAIGSAIWLLSEHPDQRAALMADWSLLDATIEEVLRLEPPIEGTFRTTTRPLQLLDAELPAEAKVRLVFASANRDETHFSDPDEFRIDRPVTELRHHLAFGQGPHSCLGAALARLQIRVAVRTMLERLPGLRLDPERPPTRSTALIVGGFRSVDVLWTAPGRPASETGMTVRGRDRDRSA